MTLFREGWKAERDYPDDVVALHMNTKSVYRLKRDYRVSVDHSAPYTENGHGEFAVDLFTVHVSVNLPNNQVEVRCVGSYDNWDGAFAHAISLCKPEPVFAQAP